MKIVEGDDFKGMAKLIRNGFPIGHIMSYNKNLQMTPMEFVIHRDASNVFDTLVDKLVDINSQTLVYKAVGSSENILEKLIGRGFMVEFCGDDHCLNPLGVAVMRGFFDVVKYLMSHGADVNFRSPVRQIILPRTSRGMCIVNFLERGKHDHATMGHCCTLPRNAPS